MYVGFPESDQMLEHGRTRSKSLSLVRILVCELEGGATGNTRLESIHFVIQADARLSRQCFLRIKVVADPCGDLYYTRYLFV